MADTSAGPYCPSPSAYRRFVAGDAPEPERSHLERHLDECPVCRSLVHQLAGDTLAGHAGTGGNATPSPGPEHDPAASQFLPIRERFTFLDPPLEQDEVARLGLYRIRGVLGEGGMGVVFDAEDTHLQRRVALKVLHPGAAASLSARQRFLQEARAAAALPHDHIITIYAVGQEKDVPFLAMQYLEGESLEDRLRRQERLPLADVLRIGLETALGLAAAHERGLIHRDVKPANIWLEKKDEGRRMKDEQEKEDPSSSSFIPHPSSFRVKLLDFGLARSVAAPSNLTASGYIVGTPQYLSPEQARGNELDGRSDLFSLGIVLYRAVTGRLPFDGSDVLAILHSLANDRPRPLAELAPGLPPRFCALVDGLLEKERNHRPANAHEVAAELAELLKGAGGSIPAAADRLPTPVVHRPRRERHAWPAWALGLSLVAFVLVNVALIWHRMANPRPPTSQPEHSGNGGALSAEDPVRLGLLFSTTGFMRDYGSPVNDAALLAISEINEAGGLLGRQIEAVTADGASDEKVYAREAERLIAQEKVSAIVGCWSSASRKAVLPVLARHDHLLLYPVQYEGLEESPHVFYLGGAPNQVVLPAVHFATDDLEKKRLFLIGTDSIYPRAVNAIIRDALDKKGKARVVGEIYVPPGVIEVPEAVKAIRDAAPDLLVTSINGETDAYLLRALRKDGVDRPPTLAFDVPEHELRGVRSRRSAGDLIACNYFESIPTPANRDFVTHFREHYGKHRALSDPMENAYVGVHIWAQAVRQTGTTDPAKVRQALKGQTYPAPSGEVRIDPKTQHTWNTIRLARIQPGGELKIIYRTEDAEPPQPFPPTRTRAEWEKFLNDLYRRWGNRWEAAPH